MTDASSQRELLSVANVLDRAADLIEPEGRWTQGCYARDLFGGQLGDGRSPSAECWCAVGAMDRVSGGLVGYKLTSPLFEVIGLSRWPSVVDWNDAPGRSQAEVVAKLREAANRARGEVL